MKKILYLSLIILLGFSSFAQSDSARITADTTAVNDKKIKLMDSTKKVIDGSIAQLSEDNEALREKEEDLKRLEKEVNRNEREIARKRKEISTLQKSSDALKSQVELTQSLLADAMGKYDTIKVQMAKMRNDSLKLMMQQDTIKKKTDSLVEKTNATQAEYNKLLLEISKKEDSLEAIAVIKLKQVAIAIKADPNKYKTSYNQKMSLSSYSKNKVTGFEVVNAAVLKDNPGSQLDSVKVSKVHLYVKEGRIAEIIVKTDKGIFRNQRCQIDLVHFGERRYKDMLFKDEESPNDSVRTFMHPGDVIEYEPIRSFGDIPYSEFEITLTPDSTGNTYIIRESTSINTYFEVAAFTDVNGVAGNANGLAQITGSAKFITSTRNWPNRTLMAFQYISFNGGLAKFDNDFKGTFINGKDSLKRKDLFQRSQYAVGVKVNLLRWVRSPYPSLLFNDLQLNTGFNFLGSRIADTLIKSSDTIYRTATQNQIYLEPIMTFSRQKNFSMSIGLPVFYQNIKESAGIANSQWEWWVCPSINLMYYSKRDSKNKIFFRYNHFINLSDKKQAFTQLQLGFSANLTNVMQGK